MNRSLSDASSSSAKRPATNSILQAAAAVPVPRAQPQPPAPVQRESLSYIGGSLVSMQRLMQNAPGTAKPSAQQVKSKASSAKESKLLEEVDALLKKRSAHAQEAEDEWFQGYAQRMGKLGAQEHMINKTAAETEAIHLQAFECTACAHLFEQYPSMCEQKKHAVRKLRAVKRFFVCNSCNKRDSTLSSEAQDQATKVHLPPNHRCQCGGYCWQACGMRGRAAGAASASDRALPVFSGSGAGAGGGGASAGGSGLISGAAEWTSGAEKLDMAVRVSAIGTGTGR